MDIEKLEKKIAELLNVPENEKKYALTVLKDKLVNCLNVGEAIKIENLGVFQLKEKLNESNKLTLLFSPDEDMASREALFINLDIDSNEKNDSEFTEDVFQIGVNKRFIPVGDNKISLDSNDNSIQLEKQINELIETSQKLENFDLWDDYLKDKESTSILIKESEVDKDVDPFFEDDITLDDDPLYDKEFVELNEDEIFDELIDETNLPDDDILSDINKNEDIPDIDTDITEITNEVIEEKIVPEVENNIVDTEIEATNKLDEIELESIEDTLNIDEETNTITKDDIPQETESESDSGEVVEDIHYTNSEGKDVGIEFGALSIDNDAGKANKRARLSKTRRSPLVYTLIAAFIIVGAIGIYYIFFENPTWLYDKYEVEAQLSEQYSQKAKSPAEINLIEDIETVTEKNSGKDLVINEKVKSKNDYNSSKQEENVKPAEIQSETSVKNKPINTINKTQKINTEVKITAATNNENEAAQNIYFNGDNYSIQVSSWKQNTIAVKEANKLLNKGYPVFIVKKYIAKLNGTWHRVRVGPYATLGEAKSVQRKIK